ncbi:MAG: hypothetical protein ACNS60_03700 [Candidatus Cyclobacteriaceae bacterium M2_1C_046]
MKIHSEEKSSLREKFSLNEPFIVQNADQMLDMKLFFKNYARACFKIAIEEYRIDSPFTLLQPKSILYKYKKETRKFGVKSDYINQIDFQNSEKLIKEDALAFVTDLCALYAKYHKGYYDAEVLLEANNVLEREEQYEFNGFYLGFGYFIKRICKNGSYAAIAVNDWFERFLIDTEVVHSIIVTGMDYTIMADKRQGCYFEPKNISLVCTYLFEKFASPKLIRLEGYINKDIFSFTEENIWFINFLNINIKMNFQEIILKLKGY